MAKLTTKVSEGSKKVIEPGEVTAVIRNVKLDPSRFKPDGYSIVLVIEGSDMGDKFEGFFIDKDNESLGRYKGQVGMVRTSEWPYADGITKSGIVIERDTEMVKLLTKLCKELGCLEWLAAQDDKHDTIEQLFNAFNIDKPYKDISIDFCLAGREYKNNKDYINYDLYLPKFSKFSVPFELAGKKAKLCKFDESIHIKKSTKVVESFGADIDDDTMEVSSSSDLELW